MAITCLTSSSAVASSPSPSASRTRITTTATTDSFFPSAVRFNHYRRNTRFLDLSLSFEAFPLSSSLLLWPTPITTSLSKKNRVFTVLAVVEETQLAVDNVDSEDSSVEEEDSTFRNLLRPCELYVCNIPRSYGISELLHLFKPHGTVQSVEVSRNAETGISRGCGYVTMSSINEAKAAIVALDGSDVDGREMRVKFSVDMTTRRGNLEALNSPPKKNLVFESPYKIYVGNLAWSVKPEDLRNLFSQFGTVVSARVLHDRKSGKNRVYGFISFSSAAELEAAMSLNGTEYYSRTLLIREVVKQN